MTLELDHDARRKSRQLIFLPDGSQAKLLAPRGSFINDGDLFLDQDAVPLVIRAKDERLIVAKSQRPLDMIKAAYYLGNQHLPLEIEEDGSLRFIQNPVALALVKSMGLEVEEILSPFNPAPGAFVHTH